MNQAEWNGGSDPMAMLVHTRSLRGTKGRHYRAPLYARLLRLYGLSMLVAWHDRGATADRASLDHKIQELYDWVDGSHGLDEQAQRLNVVAMSAIDYAFNATESFTKAGIRPVRFMVPAGIQGNRRRVPKEDACARIRDLFGDPYGPRLKMDSGRIARLAPLPDGSEAFEFVSWQVTPEAVRLAKSIYKDNLWADMPVLADALEVDSGCTDAALLGRLRGRVLCTGRLAGKELMVRCAPHGSFAACPKCGGSGSMEAPPAARGCLAVDLVAGNRG